MRALLIFVVALDFVAASTGYTLPGADERAVRSDISYIRCGVCEALAKNAHRQVKALRDDIKPSKKLSEITILETIEKLTDPVAAEGEWITKIDLVEKGGRLELVEQEQPGVCGSECKTIAKAAEEVLGDRDTDLGELLWKGDAGRAAVTKWLCREETTACTKAAPKLPKGRKPGPAFKVVDQKELDMQRMMASMQGSGMKGSLFNREEAMAMAGGAGGDEDEDDDEDEDSSGGPTAAAAGTAGLLQNVQQRVANVQQAVADASQSALEKTAAAAVPLLSKAKQGVSAAFSAVVDKLKPAPQTQPPHVEL